MARRKLQEDHVPDIWRETSAMKRLLTVAALTALLMTAGGVGNSNSANAGGSLYDGCGYGGCYAPRYSYGYYPRYYAYPSYDYYPRNRCSAASMATWLPCPARRASR